MVSLGHNDSLTAKLYVHISILLPDNDFNNVFVIIWYYWKWLMVSLVKYDVTSWVNSLRPGEAYMCQRTVTYVFIILCNGLLSLPEPMLVYHHLSTLEWTYVKLLSKHTTYIQEKKWNVVCRVCAILSSLPCVNSLMPSDASIHL